MLHLPFTDIWTVQPLKGAMQWDATTGHLDIANATPHDVLVIYGDFAARIRFTDEPLLRRCHASTFARNTGSHVCADFIETQYNQCLASHTSCCNTQTGQNFLPTRLIEVGVSGDKTVRLC